MRKLSILIMVVICIYTGTSAANLTLKGRQALKHYQAESLDEDKIVRLVLDHQKAYNLYNPKGILSVYLPGAKYILYMCCWAKILHSFVSTKPLLAAYYRRP